MIGSLMYLTSSKTDIVQSVVYVQDFNLTQKNLILQPLNASLDTLREYVIMACGFQNLMIFVQ
ncbi:uncharacterized protein DS421_1g09210 [Arachis hypogaea]|nr:uncharacterized protein DS421_1g09210 [Arachis hypogaea]